MAEGEGQFFGTLNRGRSALNDFSDTAKRAGGGFNALGEIATGALRHVGAIALQVGADIARAIGKGIMDSISTAGDFEQVLNVIGATSGATASELEQIRQKSIELGADLTLPTTSASSAAEAMLELSKAGMSVDEAMAAAQGTLQLAAAAQVDEATAAQITANALNTFNLAATEAGHVADLLAGGANASSASMTDLSQGLQQGGFAFHAAGQSIDDLVTSVAALTNVGLTGSDSGTALKNALMRLMDPTDKAAGLMKELGFSAYDANGNMKPMQQIIADLNTALAGMTQEERNAALGNIFLSDGMKAMIPLLELGENGFVALRDQVTQQGAAADVAAAQTKGWNGALAGLQSQIETVQLLIGERLLPVLTPLVQQFAAGVGVLGELVTTFFDAGYGSTEFAEALTMLPPEIQTAIAVTTMIAGILSGVFATATQSAGNTITWLQGLFNTIFPAILAVVTATLTTLQAFWAQNGADIMMTAQTTWTTVQSIVTTVVEIMTALLSKLAAFITANQSTIQFVFTNVWNVIKGIITTVMAAIEVIVRTALALITGDWNSQLTAIQAAGQRIFSGILTFITGILELIAARFGTSLDGIVANWRSNFAKFAQIAGPYMEQASSVIGSAIGAITGAFNAIKGAIDGAIGKIKDFIDAASKIKVPKLITPGSPTPLETGLVGIASAMDEVISRGSSFGDALGGMLGSADTTAGAISEAVNDLMKGKDKNEDKGSEDLLGFGSAPTAPVEVVVPDTPDFWSKIVLGGIANGVPIQSELAPAAPASPAAVAPPTRDVGIQPVTNYNMPIYTNQSPTVLQQSLDVARALAR